MGTKKLHFETLQLHVGQENPDPATDARAVPIYQTTSYVFRNSAHAAARFSLQDAGNIYGRLTNSTQGVFEARIAALEGGIAALALASGAAAITYAILTIAEAGDNIISSATLYGGTYNLFAHTLPQYGIDVRFADYRDPASFEKLIDGKTKAIYAETIPFNETRDYVKKVFANAVYYAQRFGGDTTRLKDRLGVIPAR